MKNLLAIRETEAVRWWVLAVMSLSIFMVFPSRQALTVWESTGSS